MNITSIIDGEINQIISQHTEQFGKMHLLIDPKINDDFFFNNHYEFESIIPIRDRQDTVSADHECIQLCTINKEASFINDVINELKNTDSSAIAIIFSAYAIKDIQNQMSNAMFMDYQGAYYFLRFYDPTVLKHLITIFKPTQLAQLLGVIEYWYYWDDKYIQLQHKPVRILSDIDYKITTRQWHQFNIAQSYNYYENFFTKQQNETLTSEQKNTLKQALDWTYAATYYHPDKKILDDIVNYAMRDSQQFFAAINDDVFAKLINDKTTNIKQYFAQLEKGIEHGIIR